MSANQLASSYHEKLINKWRKPEEEMWPSKIGSNAAAKIAQWRLAAAWRQWLSAENIIEE
jgi:hypothetical protein